MKGKTPFVVLSIALLATDQLTKIWATLSLRPQGSITIIPGVFNLTYAVNRGVAFSLLADSEIDIRWVLAGISTAAAILVLSYLMRTPLERKRANLALSLLLAGIIGNLIDRVRLGEVVDFLDFHWADRWAWPTFNVADAVICIGAVLLALDLTRDGKSAAKEDSHKPRSAADDSNVGSAPVSSD